MIWFIYKSNIAHYKERLAVETDPQKIATVRSEEEAKLAKYYAKNRPPKASEYGCELADHRPLLGRRCDRPSSWRYWRESAHG